MKLSESKKLIIGVSILFCTIILIVGITTAYFTQGASANIDDIVSTEQIQLEYNDDVNNYMRQGLIPSSKENAIIAYNREDGKKCLDDNNHSACSIYRFSIKNLSNVSQLLQMSLHPTANSYKNLKFMLYEVVENGENILIKDTTDLIQYSVEPITISEAYTLGITNEDKEKTFEVVFYIEAKDYDQTAEDSGKQFGAGIRIDSITTGKYLAEGFGDNCWETAQNDRTKLVKFKGINHDTGEIDGKCSAYVSGTTVKNEETEEEIIYYDIIIPSNVGGQEITTLGNNLLNAISGFDEEEEPIFNKFLNIKNITISEGIKEIEDGNEEQMLGTFVGGGYGIAGSDYNFEVSLPNTLTRIGNCAFWATTLNSINIPNSVKSIGSSSFILNSFLTTITFEKGSQLEMIEDYAFSESGISSVEIPNSVIEIGESAFSYNHSLKSLTFETQSQLQTIGNAAFNSAGITSVTIPKKVTSIGEDAFSDNWSLKSLTFESGSQLETIENRAFYATGISSVIIPKKVTSIGNQAFENNSSLKSLTFESESQLQTIGWYAFYRTVLSSLTIPKSVIEIGEGAFGGGNSSLTSLTFESGSQLETIGDYVFTGSNLTSIEIPNKVISIGDYAFKNNTGSLKSLTFESGSQLETIGDYVFTGSNLTSIEIPNKVTSIGKAAFSDNYSLESLIFENGSQLEKIGNDAFRRCNLTYKIESSPLVIPSSLTFIGSSAFSGNYDLLYIQYNGDNADILSNANGWYDSNDTTLNP